jgi:hypothetical protein
MGYTHYWYRKDREFPAEDMLAIVADFRKLIPTFDELGVKIAGGLGEGEPEYGPDGVWFNGLEKCGHPSRDLGITWPSPTAAGVAEEGKRAGTWFAGALLETRTCEGDCSHETFHFPRVLDEDGYKGSDGRYFACCKTAYKPYDLAVTAFLILAKFHLKEKLEVHSDGEDRDWTDAATIIRKILGHPNGEVEFDPDGNLRVVDSAVSAEATA